MCKVSGVVSITDENRSNVWVFMQLLGEIMSMGNSDGLGYAAFDKAGNIFGEKWLVNDTAFKDLTQVKGINATKLDKIYNYFGDRVVKNEAQAIILHTRMATCGKGIQNTHPFINDLDKPEVAIIHNGVIYNDNEFKKKYSTCDSEVLAHLYQDNSVSASLSNLNEFSEKLGGWFTVLALAKDNRGEMVMDVFSDTGRLGSYFIKELNTRVYSTNADDIQRLALKLGFTPMYRETMKADTAFRLNVLTGDEVEFLKLKTAPLAAVTHYPSPTHWEGWENVTAMEGNLSDAEFKAKWFSKGFGNWRGN